MTRIMVAIVLSAFVPAFAGDAIHTDAPGTAAVKSSRAEAVRGKLAERRAKLKAKLEAMTPEEREAGKVPLENYGTLQAIAPNLIMAVFTFIGLTLPGWMLIKHKK